METAKVDIRKLQVLNDRINQCIDALNQVRLSVHGLSHTSQGPFGSQGLSPFAQGQFGQGQFGQGQFGYPGAGPLGYSPYLQGISHSSPVVGSPGFFPGVQGISPFAGLSHSSPEEGFTRPAWADPLLAYRIAQTFPYAQYPFPAVVPIF